MRVRHGERYHSGRTIGNRRYSNLYCHCRQHKKDHMPTTAPTWIDVTAAAALPQPAAPLRLYSAPPRGALLRLHTEANQWRVEQRFQLETAPGAELCLLTCAEPDRIGNVAVYRQWTVGPPGAPVSARTLAAADVPAARQVVEGIIPEGLVILASRPKCGKSSLILSISLSVARGEPWHGRAVDAGPVLYVSLEDTYGRLQERIGAMTSSPPPSLHVVTDLAPNDEGLAQLAQWQDQYRPRLTIIDTLQRWRHGKASTYHRDYADAARLKALAIDRALVIVHHTSKRQTSNPLDSVSGSSGLTGAADAVLVLARAQHRGALYATGKDMPEAAIPLNWSAGRWYPALAPPPVPGAIARLTHQ